MTYRIHVRVIQSNPSAWYSIVEKTVFSKGGAWTSNDGDQVLTMGASGISGMLRFRNPQGYYFLVALGIHNYKRWCDVIVDASASATCEGIHPTYYEGTCSRHDMLWKQLACIKTTSSKGVHVNVDYYYEEGTTLWATIRISSSSD